MSHKFQLTKKVLGYFKWQARAYYLNLKSLMVSKFVLVMQDLIPTK